MNPYPPVGNQPINPQYEIPPKPLEKNPPVKIVWHRHSHPPHFPQMLDPSSPNLTLFSFKKPLEEVFECLKKLEVDIETMLAPEGVGVKQIENEVIEAKDRLKILSTQINQNSRFKQAFGKTINTMWQRLKNCEDVFIVQKIGGLKTEIAETLSVLAKEIPENDRPSIPNHFPENYSELIDLENAINDSAIDYAGKYVNNDTPSNLLSEHGKKLNLLTKARDLLRDYKGLLADKQVKETSKSTKHLLIEFERLAGYISPDQKWALAMLSELNLPFEDKVQVLPPQNHSDDNRQQNQMITKQTTTREVLYKTLNIAKKEKEANKKEIAKDEYSHLSPKIGRSLTELISQTPEMFGDNAGINIFKQLSSFSNLLMAKIGSNYNSQPITDSIPTMLGNERSGITGRYVEREKGYQQKIYGYPIAEQPLIKDGYLEWDEYGYWLKNDYIRSGDGQSITWKGIFQFVRPDGTMSEATASETIDFSNAPFIRNKHLQVFIDFLSSVASLDNPSDIDRDQISINSLDKIPQHLQMAIYDNEEFWKRLAVKELNQSDTELLPEILNRYTILKDLALNYALSLNKQLRKLFFESAGQTAADYDPSSFSLVDKIGFTVRWVFASLGEQLRDFILAPSINTHAIKEQPGQAAVNFNQSLVPSQFHLKIQGASRNVSNLYNTYSPLVKGLEQKERVFDLLVKVESKLTKEKWENLDLKDLVAFREAIKNEFFIEMAGLNQWNYEFAKPQLKKLIDACIGQIDVKIEEMKVHKEKITREIPLLSQEFIAKNPATMKLSPHALEIIMHIRPKVAEHIYNNIHGKGDISSEIRVGLADALDLPGNFQPVLYTACQVPLLKEVIDDSLNDSGFNLAMRNSTSTENMQIRAQRIFIQKCIDALKNSDDEEVKNIYLNKFEDALDSLPNIR